VGLRRLPVVDGKSLARREEARFGLELPGSDLAQNLGRSRERAGIDLPRRGEEP